MASEVEWFVAVAAEARTLGDLSLLKSDLTFCEVEPAWLNSAGDSPTALTSSAWRDLASPDLVRDAARVAVEAANVELRRDSPLHAELHLGNAVWQRDSTLAQGFRRSFYVEAASGVLVLSGMTGTVTVARDGYRTFPPRTVGLRQRELADRNVAFHAAVAVFDAAGEDFGSLWLVWEYVEKRSGHKPNRFAPTSEINAFCSTANDGHHIRHIGSRLLPQHRMMKPREARDLMRRLLEGWLEAENPH
jgi:hypothetical protein